MKHLMLIAVSAFGLSQTACEMKIASDNVVNANIQAPNSSVFGGLPSAPGTNGVPSTPAAVPVTVATLPAGLTPTTPGATTTGGTIPMVPITTSSVNFNDAQKSNAVRASLLNTFSKGTVSTFQLARNPSSTSTPVVLKPAAVKTVKREAAPLVAVNREPKVEVSHAVESAR